MQTLHEIDLHSSKVAEAMWIIFVLALPQIPIQRLSICLSKNKIGPRIHQLKLGGHLQKLSPHYGPPVRDVRVFSAMPEILVIGELIPDRLQDLPNVSLERLRSNIGGLVGRRLKIDIKVVGENMCRSEPAELRK